MCFFQWEAKQLLALHYSSQWHVWSVITSILYLEMNEPGSHEALDLEVLDSDSASPSDLGSVSRSSSRHCATAVPWVSCFCPFFSQFALVTWASFILWDRQPGTMRGRAWRRTDKAGSLHCGCLLHDRWRRESFQLMGQKYLVNRRYAYNCFW